MSQDQKNAKAWATRRVSLRLVAVIAVVSCSVWPGVHYVVAQERRTVSELFQELQSRQTSGQAAAQLLELGNTDARARQYLAHHLPLLIEAGPRDPRPQWHDVMRLQWYNAVQLAGELKIVDTAPALAKWISFRTDDGVTGLSHDESLQASPAATGLVQIGDAAIPTLQRLLAHGNRDERWQAVYALNLIGSPKAKAALRDYEVNGHDRELADFIRRAASK